MTGFIENLSGKWVRNEDLFPGTNIMGRRYWAPECQGIYEGKWPTKDGQQPKTLYWQFPED